MAIAPPPRHAALFAGISSATRRLVACVLAGVLLALSFPPYNLPILMPLGVALLLLAIESAKVRHAAYLGFVTGLVFYGLTLFWLGNLFGSVTISLIAIA